MESVEKSNEKKSRSFNACNAIKFLSYVHDVNRINLTAIELSYEKTIGGKKNRWC